MISAVVFDIDQTLWDFRSHRDAGLRACLDMLVSRRATEAQTTWSIGDLQARWERLAAANTDADLAQIRRKTLHEAAGEAAPFDATLGEDLCEVYFSHRHRTGEPFPDVLPCLTQLRERGYQLGIVSNGNSQLNSLKLDGWWDAVVLGPQHGLAKPDPRIYQLVAERIGADPSTLVCVGDDPVKDVAGPQAVGWRGIWNRRDAAPLPEGIVPDATVDELTDLVPIIAEW